MFSWVNDWHLVEMPFHFRHMLNKKISIFAGPKVDLAADRFDKTEESKSKLLGLSAEAGVQYDLHRHFFVEAKYSAGITKSINEAEFDINNGRRNNFRVGAGYRF